MDKIFNKTKKVLEGIATKLSEALMTVQGWLIGLLIVIVNFFAGYQLVLYGVLIAVAFDALFGICVARKRGEFILSELLRATIFKLAIYFNLIVVFVFIDKFVTTGGIETKITTVILGSAICLAEAWSSCGNALIISPNFPFLRLFRKALTGEIARKLNVNPEDVENILNSTKK